MARPLRIEYPGALYHLTSRGPRKEDIFLDEDDREAYLEWESHVLAVGQRDLDQSRTLQSKDLRTALSAQRIGRGKKAPKAA